MITATSRTRLARLGMLAALAAGLAVAADPTGARPPATAWADTATATAAQAASTDPKIPFEKYTLDNGLEVILVQDNTVPLVAVSVWYHVGSGHETPGKSGFAHLFEHMLFQGSKNVGEDRHFDVLKQMGSSNVNGTTNPDRTNYFEVVPSNQLEAVLWLEADRMGFLLPMLTQKSLDNQIDVVRNERRQRYDNVPYGKARFELAAMLYPEGHPYRYLTIGKHEDLESASLDDVIQFYKTWYVPANATLAIAGDFDVAEAKRLVQTWFGGFPKSEKPPVVAVPAPLAKAQRKEITDDFAKLRQLQYSWISPANVAEGDAELDLLATTLGGGEASRLYKLLVVEKQLAQSVMAYQWGQTFSGTFNIVVTLQGNADLAEVERLVEAEVERVRKEAITERELRRAVTSVEAGAIYGLESLLGRAERLQSFNHFYGDPDRITFDLDRYRNATAAGVQDWAQRVLDPAHRVLLVVQPATGGAK